MDERKALIGSAIALAVLNPGCLLAQADQKPGVTTTTQQAAEAMKRQHDTGTTNKTQADALQQVDDSMNQDSGVNSGDKSKVEKDSPRDGKSGNDDKPKKEPKPQKEPKELHGGGGNRPNMQ